MSLRAVLHYEGIFDNAAFGLRAEAAVLVYGAAAGDVRLRRVGPDGTDPVFAVQQTNITFHASS